MIDKIEKISNKMDNLARETENLVNFEEIRSIKNDQREKQRKE
jgi:hypothetical protein